MSLIPCTECAQRQPGGAKRVHCTAAWNLTDGSRRAYRHHLCIACFVAMVAPLEPDPDNESLVCPSCHGSSEDDLDPVYVTYFPFSAPKQNMEVAFCGACAASWRSMWQDKSEHLPEREAPSGGPESAPRLDAGQMWAALGLRPR